MNGECSENATESWRRYYMQMARQPGFNKIIHQRIFVDESKPTASQSPSMRNLVWEGFVEPSEQVDWLNEEEATERNYVLNKKR